MKVQQKQDINKIQTTFDYSSLVPKTHPFFQLIQPIISQLQILLTPNSQPQPNNPTNPIPFPLKIYTTLSPSQKLNCFLYKYTIPVNLSTFIKFSQDVKLQKQLDPNIQTYHVLKPVDDFGKVMYLAYKKVLFISGRDFIYERYACTIKKNGQIIGQNLTCSQDQLKQYLIISASIEGQDQRPGFTRGRLVRNILRAIKNEDKTDIQVFSQVDMKMQMKPQNSKPKGILQIKKYAQRCYNYLTKNK